MQTVEKRRTDVPPTTLLRTGRVRQVRAPLQPRGVHELHRAEHLCVSVRARRRGRGTPSRGRHHPHGVQLRQHRRGRGWRDWCLRGRRLPRLKRVHRRLIHRERAVVHGERCRQPRGRRGLKPPFPHGFETRLFIPLAGCSVGLVGRRGGRLLSLILVHLARLATRGVVRAQRVPARVPGAVKIADGLEAGASLAESALLAVPDDVQRLDVRAARVVAPAVVQSSELAIEEINAEGGILGHTVELVVADDGSGAAGRAIVDGVVFGLQTLLPLLPPGAAIVATASLAGITPYAIDPLYAMSKHAVVGLVRSLAPDLAKRGIRIHALCPGAVDTKIIPHAQKTKDAKFMTPDDLAKDVIELMAEPESGKSWVRLRADKPRYVIRAPGDKTG